MSLKVFDLQCDAGHVFEGWFASSDSYESQRDKGLLSCPACDSRQISKKLSAPRINMGHGKADDAASPVRGVSGVSGQGAESPQLAQLQARVMQHIREMVRKTENVGPRFAEEARRIHEGEVDERPIRGTATEEERMELARDGIEVFAIPDFLDDDRLQ